MRPVPPPRATRAPSRLRGAAAVLALAVGLGVAGGALARAGDPPPAPPPAGTPAPQGSPGGAEAAPPAAPPAAPGVPVGPGPASPGPDASEGASAAPGAPAEGALTEDELFALVRTHPSAFLSLLALRFGTAAAGVVVMVLLLVRRSEVRRGLVAPPAPRPPAVAPFELPGALAVLGLWFVAGPLLAAGAARVVGDPDGKPTLVTSLVSMCVATLPIAVGVGVLARRRRAERGPPALPPADALRVAGGTFLVSAAAVLVLQLAAGLVLQHVLGRRLEMQDLVTRMVRPRSAVEPWLISFLGVVVAPFAEEAVFRGTLYPAVRRHLGARGAAVVVSALFAAIHANWLALVPLFALALLLTWCYERTGSIFACVVVHALSNASSLVPLLLTR